MAKTYQINNLKIIYSKTFGMWVVKNPQGRIVEDFMTLENAKKWARKTHDYVRR